MFIASEQGVISSSLAFTSKTYTTAANNQTITFSDLEDGTYTGVILSVTDSSGNEGTLIIPEFIIDVTDGSNDIPYFASLVLYPNPAIDQVHLSNPSYLDLNEVIMYDLIGRTVHKVDLTSIGLEITIDVSHLVNATYILVIKGSRGTTTKKSNK